jgi:hypothetical protein
MLTITGKVLQVETVEPFIDRQTGEARGERHVRLHLLSGVDVYRLRVAPGFSGELPKTDTEVSLAATVRAYKDRDGKAQLAYGTTGYAQQRPAAVRHSA